MVASEEGTGRVKWVRRIKSYKLLNIKQVARMRCTGQEYSQDCVRFFSSFLVTLRGMWDLSSPTRIASVSRAGDAESYPLDHQGRLIYVTYNIFIWSMIYKKY